MLEKQIERKLVSAIKALGGLALKFTSPGFNGVPDRLILLPEGKIVFVELKAPHKHLRALQRLRARELGRLGFAVYCLNDPKEIPALIADIQQESW